MSPTLRRLLFLFLIPSFHAIGQAESPSPSILSLPPHLPPLYLCYLLAEGTEVEAGELLLACDPLDLRDHSRKLERQISQTRERVQRAQAKLSSLERAHQCAREKASLEREIAELQLQQLLKIKAPQWEAELRKEHQAAQEKARQCKAYLADLSHAELTEELLTSSLSEGKELVDAAEQEVERRRLQLEEFLEFSLPLEIKEAEARRWAAQLEEEESHHQEISLYEETLCFLEREEERLAGLCAEEALTREAAQGFKLYAPVAGTLLYKIPLQEGLPLQGTEPLMEIGSKRE